MPTVHKPGVVIRELRKLYSTYEMLNPQAGMLKNGIQALLLYGGVVLGQRGKDWLFSGKADAVAAVAEAELSGSATRGPWG